MMKSYGLVFLSVLAVMCMGQSSASAQAQMGGIPQFLPTGGWQVQETVLSKVRGLQGVDLPCMMATKYDNGYSLRISGSGQQILAMAIDFRQDIFTQGRKYTAQLSIDDKYNRTIKGTAFSESILIFNMRNYDSFYSAIFNAVKMKLDIEDNPMVFALGGIDRGLEKLNNCSMGEDFTSDIQQASLPSKAVSIPRAPSDGWAQEVTPVPARISKDIKKAQMAKGAVWTANAGDGMKTTLDGWARRAGVKLDWRATGNASVVDDISVQGSFEDAVQLLMAQNAAVSGLDANMKEPAGMSRMSSRVSMPAASSAPQQLIPRHMGRSNVSTAGHAAGSKWSADTGVSLQQVLQQWSKRAGVELVWQSNQGFSVRRAVAAGGSYEAALQSLLGQYTGERIHPVAQLNNDPVTGQRILFIQSSRVL